MNHCYRLVRSADGQRTLPAPETARGHGKSTGSKALACASVVLGMAAAGSVGAQAPPPTPCPRAGRSPPGMRPLGKRAAR